MTDLDAARAERDLHAIHTVARVRDGQHIARAREESAWADLVAARRAWDQGIGQHDAAALEVALDRYRDAARACRRAR